MFELRSASRQEWLDTVLRDFDRFLVDHAACERKASATGMSFVVRYPDRPMLVEAMIDFSLEELEHFQQVFRLMQARGLQLEADEKDPYVATLMQQVRNGREERLLDRLLLAGIVEARGCERLGMIAEALPDPLLRQAYVEFQRAEARHHGLFFRLARHYFDEETTRLRAAQLLDLEASTLAALPLRAALH